MTPDEERIVDAFEDAWQLGSPPRLEDFGSSPRPALEEIVKVDLEYRWRRKEAERLRLEDYYARWPLLGAVADAPAELIAEEYRVRRRWGDEPLPGEYQLRFPARGEQLAKALSSVDTDLLAEGAAKPEARTKGAPSHPEGYELLGEIGRGGMGVVYKARQRSLGRFVALKMILSGAHAGPRDLARFRAEAEALAQLQHPNIVQVYETGEEDGRPYFVLELVEGGSLAQQLLGIPLSAGTAAELAEKLARAVQAAHTHGIIHRDLKPANVLLSRQEGVADLFALPKITDFGLAKRIGAEEGPTLTGSVLGTPSYMAPEQAAGKVKEIGTRADVYALGAILYELITGRPPFRAATTVETMELVKTQEPVHPTRLQPRLPRDIETICLKCLEKDPRRRYASARELADDLLRFREDRPILARPASAMDRSLKWARRRRATATLIVVTFFFLVSLVLGALLYSARIRTAYEKVEGQRARADGNLSKAFDAVSRLLDRVGYSKLADVPGMEDVRRQLLEDSLSFYDGLLTGGENADPALRKAFEEAHYRLATILLELGRFGEAERKAIEHLDLKSQASAEQKAAPEFQHRLGLGHILLGSILRADRRPKEAREQLEKAIAILEPLAPIYPASRADLAQAYNNLAVLPEGPVDIEQLHRKALKIREELAAEAPDNFGAQTDLAQTHHNLGMLYQGRTQREPAEKSFRSAMQGWEKLLARQPGASGIQNNLAESYSSLGFIVGATRLQDGVELLGKALEIHKRLARDFPKVLRYRSNLARAHHNLGTLHVLANHRAEAEGPLLEAVRLNEAMAKEDPAQEAVRQSLAEDYLTLGLIYHGVRRMEEASKMFRSACDMLESLLEARPGLHSTKKSLGACLVNYGNLTSDLGDPEKGLGQLDRSVQLLGEILAETPGDATAAEHIINAHGARALLLEKLSRPGQAVADWDALIQLEADGSKKEMHRLWRARAIARSGDGKRTLAEVVALLRWPVISHANLYELTLDCSLAAASSSPELREACIEKGLEILRRLADSGYFHTKEGRSKLESDPDLATLRAAKGFEDVRTSLSK